MGVQVRGNSGVIIEKLVAKDSIEEVMESISSGKLNDLAYDQSKSESTKSKKFNIGILRIGRIFICCFNHSPST